MVVDDPNLREQHFFVKNCPNYWFYDLGDINRSITTIEQNLFTFIPTPRDGGWLWCQRSGKAWVLPADPHFFETSTAMDFVRRMFKGIDQVPAEKPYFDRAYRACCLQNIMNQPDRYERISWGYLLPRGASPPQDRAPPLSYETLRSGRTDRVARAAEKVPASKAPLAEILHGRLQALATFVADVYQQQRTAQGAGSELDGNRSSLQMDDEDQELSAIQKQQVESIIQELETNLKREITQLQRLIDTKVRELEDITVLLNKQIEDLNQQRHIGSRDANQGLSSGEKEEVARIVATEASILLEEKLSYLEQLKEQQQWEKGPGETDQGLSDGQKEEVARALKKVEANLKEELAQLTEQVAALKQQLGVQLQQGTEPESEDQEPSVKQKKEGCVPPNLL